ILEPIAAGRADFVLGARRRTGGHPAHATLGTQLIARLIAWRHGAHVTDIPPFRAIRVTLLRELDMRDRAFGWPVAMVAKAAARGARFVEAEGPHRPRAAGRSKVPGPVAGTPRAGYAFFVIALPTTKGAA